MTSSTAKKLTLFALSWPIFVEQLLHQLVGTVDIFMVGRISPNAVAALDQPTQILWISITIFMFVGVGSGVVITHHLGAQDRAGADRIAAAAIGVNTWIGLVVSLAVFLFAEPMLRLVRLPASLVPLAMSFLPLMGGTLFLEAQNIAMGAVLRAHGHTRDPMWVTLVQNVINAGGNALLIFGLFGLPRLGITGVAISGVVSRLVAFGLMWTLVHRRTSVRMHVRNYFTFPVREVRRILHIGLPAAGENLCWSIAFAWTTSFMAQLGPTALATKAYVMQISMYVIILGGSIGMGTEIIVGRHVGAGDFEAAYHTLLRSLRTGFLAVCAGIVPIAFFAPHILGALTGDQAIVLGGAFLLRMGLVLEPGRVFNVVVISSLRATGDSRFPLYIGLASMGGLWVPLSWLLGLKLGLGLPGFWIAMMTDEWFRGSMMYLRWKRRRWVKHAVRSKAHTEAGIADLAAI